MAKVTITLEDIEGGLSMSMHSDPPYPEPPFNKEAIYDISFAMFWGIEISEWLAHKTMEIDEEEHQCDENCSH